MTPIELQTICDKHGGQMAIAEKIGVSREHLNRMAKGRKAIPAWTEKLLLLLFPSVS